MEIFAYEKKHQEDWDYFVRNESSNGTFLHTRQFLEYHPAGRFVDSSLIVKKKGQILAVIPACLIEKDGKRKYISHAGSTYGGIITRINNCGIESIYAVVSEIENYIKGLKADSIIYKITPNIFSVQDNELIEFVLWNLGYGHFMELNTYINNGNIDGNDDFFGIKKNKVEGIKRSIRSGLTFRLLENDDEIRKFYMVLVENLKKYNVNPVHTVEELLLFKNKHLQQEVDFYGVWDQEKLVAGSMVFNFVNTRMMHAQYLCSDYEYKSISPMSLLIYSLIKESLVKEYRGISWGKSTENKGKIVNMPLATSKERFCGSYYNSKTFYKELGANI